MTQDQKPIFLISFVMSLGLRLDGRSLHESEVREAKAVADEHFSSGIYREYNIIIIGAASAGAKTPQIEFVWCLRPCCIGAAALQITSIRNAADRYSARLFSG